MANNSSRPCNTSTAVRWCVVSGMEGDCIRRQAPKQSLRKGGGGGGRGGGRGGGEKEVKEEAGRMQQKTLT